MYLLLHIIGSILPAHPKGPMCRIDPTADESDGDYADWTPVLQRLRSVKNVPSARGWLRFSTNYESFAQARVIKRHKDLLNTSTVYRGLDIISHLFGAYDNRTPPRHRGGMIKVHKIFGK